jgi:hypothetical protein
MEKHEIYGPEQAFLARKFPTLGIKWVTRELIEQLISPLLERQEAEFLCQKLIDGLQAKAKQHVHKLVQLVEVDKRTRHSRIVIAVRLLREYFADELTDHGDSGGGGGPKNRINPTTRFGRF